ncbi:MAG: tetraacyldisaccharide 4'-kinase [Magnetococcales bacterium]|nr:tetraacyldisaccharide 4'-kinase [Magnetococcales bacterium]
MSRFNALLPLLDGRRTPSTWAEKSLFALLGPLGQLHGLIQKIRAFGYAHNWLERYHPPRPVISIGNLTTGGTGKTPMTAFMASLLLEMGLKPVIISRGYGQGSKAAITVVSDGEKRLISPPEAADEACLLADRLPTVPVLTGPKRSAVIQAAVDQFDVDIILLDDAYQHLAVDRDINILLMDASHPLANGRLLPAGLLREFPSASKRADIIIFTRCPSEQRFAQAKKQISAWITPSTPIFQALHKPSHWYQRKSGQNHKMNSAPKGTGLAFCGLASPEVFWKTLQQQQIPLADTLSFTDHHNFNKNDLSRLEQHAQAAGADFLVCTEKDAVKIEWQSDLPLYVLTIDLSLDQRDRFYTLCSTMIRK